MRFCVLGPVAAQQAGRAVTIPRAQRRGLLAFLLLRPGTIVTAEALREALWAGTPPATARQQVQTAVHALRQAFREAGAPELLRHEGAGYLLEVGPGQLDLLDFRLAVARGRAAAHAGDPVRATAEFGDGLALWRGPALTGAGGAFVAAARAGLDDERVTAIEDWAHALLERGTPSEALAVVAPVLADHPLRERLQALHLRALHRSGRQSEALAGYRRLRTRLAGESGIDPGAELQDLEREMLRGGPVAHRPAGPVVVPAMLPLDTAAFSGRRAELARLDELLAAPPASRATPVVVITGTGGVGKTALAVHWAHRGHERFPDGRLHVDLRGYSGDRPLRPVEALARLLHALGVPPAGIPAEPDQAAAEYRRLLLHRRTVVLLDNAHDADQVRPLLPAGGDSAVIVTSRSRLGGLVAREGAKPLTLEPLSDRESLALLGVLLGPGEVGADRPAAAELARLCGHLPLALGIAAADLRQRRQSIAGFRDRLRGTDRLAALSIDDDRDAAMARTIDLSYEALEPDARQLLRRLGLVPGADFTEAAAAALTADPPAAHRRLRLLTDLHLVREHAPGRFQFHDLLRLYAAARALAEDDERERDRSVTRLAAFYLGHTDAAARTLYPQMIRLEVPPELRAPASFAGPAEAVAWLDAERANLLAAVEGLQDKDAAPTAAYLLADSLRGYLFLRMDVVDWRRAATAGLRAAEAAGDEAGQAAALLSLATLDGRTGDPAAASDGLERALRHARQAGWADGENSVLSNLGAAHRTAGRLAAAAGCHRLGLRMSRERGLPLAAASHLGNLGVVLNELGDLPAALTAYREALVLFEQAGSHQGRAYASVNIGEVSVRLGDLDTAREHLERAGRAATELDDKALLAGVRSAGAHLHLAHGRSAEAMAGAAQSLEIAREIGDRGMQTKALAARAAVMLARRAGPAALMDFEEAAQVADLAGLRLDEVIALLGQARAHRLLGDAAAARNRATAARELARRHGYEHLARQADDLLREDQPGQPG